MSDVVQVAIGLGSNLGDPLTQLARACRAIQCFPQSRWLALSDAYVSSPQGPQDQPDFVNAVCLIETRLSARSLLEHLQAVEAAQGRVKQRHWGERVIDLDILLYGDAMICESDLTVPHAQIAQRDFVLLPLAQLCPEVVIPSFGDIERLISRLPMRFVTHSMPFMLD
ncbi:MAG: 2-amino-4-hydroxy-6-hydroxymethyldihydropteridine diphosphokinase [Thiomicrospira sp.]|nr:2-amino-4-hydroxy-6-hydroxymethyldihydropteridine diphosphokinase [Thiomicrospira sp.]